VVDLFKIDKAQRHQYWITPWRDWMFDVRRFTPWRDSLFRPGKVSREVSDYSGQKAEK